jgi:hypothetical protein
MKQPLIKILALNLILLSATNSYAESATKFANIRTDSVTIALIDSTVNAIYSFEFGKAKKFH